MQQTVFACNECDYLIQIDDIPSGHVASCPRCHHHILHRKVNSINRTIAISASGLLLFLPATFYPLMSMQILSIESSASLFTGMLALWKSELYLVASLVFVFCIFTPFIKLLSAFIICFGLKMNYQKDSWYKQLLLFYHKVDSWEMLEVFMVGILVSIFKLNGMADLSLNIGLLCFAALMLCVIALKVTLDKPFIWDAIYNDR